MHSYSALLCIAVHPKRFTIMWGGGSLLNHHQCAASTWIMWRLPLGLWRYWIFPYRGEAATNIAVWRLIARPPPPKKINWRGRTCASLRLHAAEPQHIVAGVRFHWSREEMYFQRERFVGRAYTHCISTSTKVHAAGLSSTHWMIWFSN